MYWAKQLLPLRLQPWLTGEAAAWPKAENNWLVTPAKTVDAKPPTPTPHSLPQNPSDKIYLMQFQTLLFTFYECIKGINKRFIYCIFLYITQKRIQETQNYFQISGACYCKNH